ncbi:histidine phosphatase family protein [Aquipuribacter sp. SD81]|uniref:histidine phosphatase family protein n=1 Tax=Aquipuribacter sp. SD81 TaxID=3127703 RepID=UPI00301861D4
MAGLVVLLRHGETTWNAAARFQGQHDTDLSEAGRSQAEAAAAPLAAALADRAPRLVASDLRRARDTADPLAAALGVPVLPDPRLREVAAGTWQGLLQPEISALDPERYRAWRSGEDVPLGGAERPSEAGARVAGAVLEHLPHEQDGDGVLVAVGHGASARAAVAHLLGLPALRGSLVPLGNLAAAVLERTGDGRERWRLRGWNVPPHAVAAVLAASGAAPVAVT